MKPSRSRKQKTESTIKGKNYKSSDHPMTEYTTPLSSFGTSQPEIIKLEAPLPGAFQDTQEVTSYESPAILKQPTTEDMRLIADYLSGHFSDSDYMEKYVRMVSPFQYSPELSKVLRSSISQNRPAVCRLFAYYVDSLFRSSILSLRELNHLANAISLLHLGYSFSNVHIANMKRRFIECDTGLLRNDINFARVLEETMGPSVLPIIYMIEDLKIITEKSGFASGRVLPSYFYGPQPAMAPPKNIRQALEVLDAENRRQYPARKLTWSTALSFAVIDVSNVAGIQTIRCRGDFASVLLLLASQPSTVADICRELDCKPSSIEPLLEFLISERCGRIVKKKGSTYNINEMAAVEGGVLTIPVMVPEINTQIRAWNDDEIGMTKESMIEEKVLKALLKEPGLTFDQLWTEVQGYLPFAVDICLMDASLDIMIKDSMISKDTTGSYVVIK